MKTQTTENSNAGKDEQAEQWAAIFNTFSQEGLREVLFDAAKGLRNDEERRVIEISDQGDEYAALDITDYHGELERHVPYEKMSD